MSHPVPGHDYGDKDREETNKDYSKRMKKGKSVKKALNKIKK